MTAPGRLAAARRRLDDLRPDARRLALMSAVEAVGRGVFMSGSVVFFTLYSHLTAGQVAVGLSIAGLAGAVASVVLGVAADRVGPRRLLLVLYVASTAAFAAYPLVRTAELFYPLVALVAFLEWGRGPAKGAIIGRLVPIRERVGFQALLRTINNLAISVGGGLAALALVGDRALLAVPLIPVLCLATAGWLALRLPPDRPVPAEARPARLFHGVRDRWFMAVVGVSAVQASHHTILLVTLPLWILEGTSLPAELVPLTLVLNTAIVILLQIRLSRGADTVSGAATVARRSGWWLAAACGVLAATAASWPAWAVLALLVLAVALLSIGEILQAAAGWGMAFGLAPDHARGDYLGAFDLHYGAQNILGPAVLSGLVLSGGAWGWLAIAGALLLASAAIRRTAARSEAALAATWSTAERGDAA